jgi:peptidoglycan/xylan/chitin deacetylase (PgdA/CDA1 family)
MSEGFKVALTFDAEHPDRPPAPPGNAERILDTLATEQVRSTFFIQGRWAEAWPDHARRIRAEGHLIGHHSHYHARMPLLSADGLRSDILDGQRCITQHAGVDPRPWFRLPFGEGHEDAELLKQIAELGYTNVHWNVEVSDWEPDRTGAAIATDAADAAIEHGDGAVILLHTWPKGTGDGLQTLINRLKDAGADFVAVDQLAVLPS